MISGISVVVRRRGFGYLAYEPSGISIRPLPDIGLSVDDIGAAPPGWYTIVKEIEVNNLKSYDLVAVATWEKANS